MPPRVTLNPLAEPLLTQSSVACPSDPAPLPILSPQSFRVIVYHLFDEGPSDETDGDESLATYKCVAHPHHQTSATACM